MNSQKVVTPPGENSKDKNVYVRLRFDECCRDCDAKRRLPLTHSLQVDLIWNQSLKFYEIITSEIRRRTRINIERE